MEIKTIIKEQREELRDIENRERLIKRELLQKAVSYLKYPNILAVTGIRRCGKSILSYLLAKDKSFGYINFDDERLSGLKPQDLNKVLESFYQLYGDIEYVILDEIQNVAKWELFVNRLRRTKKIIITGSNSKLLSGELSTHLTGRYIDIVLYPFSFKEFLDFKKIKTEKDYTTKEKAAVLCCLEEYLALGGFPETNKFGKAILSRIYNDIITKDILLRYKIKKTEKIKELAKYMITNFCQEASYRKLAATLGVKRVSTISNWVSYLEDSFLIHRLERFSFKLKQQIIAPKKFYCVDTGIVSAVAFSFSENKGYFMENAAAIKLQEDKLRDNSEVYYWKDYQQNEVDFVVKKGKKVSQLIQVSYIQRETEIKERQIKPLLKASEELNCNNLSVVTWDYQKQGKYKGKRIEFVPLWRWLLS